jgi:hypothetical protein
MLLTLPHSQNSNNNDNMKQLYSLLSALLLMLMLPIGASAANVRIHFWNGSTTYDTNPFGETQSITVKGSALATQLGTTGNVLNFGVKIDESGGINWYHPNTSISSTGTTTTCLYNVSGGNTITLPGNLSNYVLTFTASNYTENSTITIKVDWTLDQEYQISTDGGSTWSTFTSGSTILGSYFPFLLRKKSGSSYTYFNSSSTTLTSGTALAATQASEAASATSYTTAETSVSGFTLDLTDTSVKITNLGTANAYYLMSTALGATTHQERFRLIPSRVRGGGALSTTLFTLNLKDDEIKKLLVDNGGNEADAVDYWIERGDGTAFDPYTDYALGKLGNTGTTGSTTRNGNVQSETYNDTKNSTGEHYFSLGRVAGESKGVSYTWLFNASGTYPLTLNINKAALEEPTKTFYVIGNFDKADANKDIYPYDTTNRLKMTRLVYKNGTGIGFVDDETAIDATGVDSVVYRATVSRPAEGWGELFMAVANSQQVEGSTSTNWSGTTGNWYNVIRPQVQSNMDGIALEGGVFWCDGSTNGSQALNPQASTVYANATTYTFSVNFTTSTYRITFNDEDMYIWGSAVADGSAYDYYDTDGTIKQYNALKLTWDNSEQCFKYMGTDGTTETPIKFTPNGTFNFVYGRDFTNTWFGEDSGTGAVPANMSDASNAYTADGPDYDTQYVNYLDQYKSSVNQMRDAAKKITFGLRAKPGGYIIRLYIKKIGDVQRFFYTIDRQLDLNYWSDVEGKIEGYDYYRAYSEWHAVKIPTNVTAYVVTAIDDNQKLVTLTPLSTSYIPARTGVILAGTSSAIDSNGQASFVTYADDPEATFSGTNLLTAQIPNKTFSESEEVNGTTYYNYIFSYIQNVEGKNVAGFYTPYADVESGRNYAYLRSTTNYNTGSNTSSAKGYRMVVNDGGTTGITNISAAQDEDVWYNLQGVKTTYPTQKGIYIKNGRKYIIK